MLYLLQVADNRVVRTTPLTHKHIDLGRGEDNHVIFPNQEVSRHHARLILNTDALEGGDNPRCEINDFGSTYGVWVEQERVTYYELKIGELFQIHDQFALCLSYDSQQIQTTYIPSSLLAQTPSQPPQRLGTQIEMKVDDLLRDALADEEEESLSEDTHTNTENWHETETIIKKDVPNPFATPENQKVFSVEVNEINSSIEEASEEAVKEETSEEGTEGDISGIDTSEEGAEKTEETSGVETLEEAEEGTAEEETAEEETIDETAEEVTIEEKETTTEDLMVTRGTSPRS